LRNDGGDENGDCQGDGKIRGKRRPTIIAHEEKRNEDGDERDGERNDGGSRFCSEPSKRLAAAIRLFDVAADVSIMTMASSKRRKPLHRRRRIAAASRFEGFPSKSASPSFLSPSRSSPSSFLFSSWAISSAAFPRICHHPGSHHSRLRRRFSNAHSHDVCQAPPPSEKEEEKLVLSQVRGMPSIPSLLSTAKPYSLSCAIAPPHFSSPLPTLSARSSSTSTSQRILSRPGYRRDPRRFRRPARCSFISMAQRQQALADTSSKTRRSRVFLPSSASTARIPPSTRPHPITQACNSPSAK